MSIVQTVNFSSFRSAFDKMNRSYNFSDSGLSALFDYLENYSEETGENLELDVIALCCDYSENEAEEVNHSYRIGIEIEEDESEEDFTARLNDEVEKYLEENTYVVMNDNGTFLYANF